MGFFEAGSTPPTPPWQGGEQYFFSLPDIPNIMSIRYDYSGKVVLVTGSSRGIGASILEAFAQAKATCIVNYFADAEGQNAKDAAATAERIRSGIENARTGGEGIDVTASIGVSVSTQDGLSNPDTLMKAADDALYHAKSGGKNRVAVWPFSPSVTAEIATAARASTPAGLLELAVSEVERNIPKTGISSLTLETST